eukprot:TRINITY_DN47435_c0_g1_i1.p1 TRINITY_DN47435_c0_g1~~TRINITY_DN47435_c0_g1_i1.p1  ORF type:complete len:558 (+),score=151.90 TRINITY_DN47435_c0_g1_i1:61-1734(+)
MAASDGQPAATDAATKAGGDKPEEAEEKSCRYCFEGEEAGELIDPCSCAGGLKWVHLACLRRWQREVLVSQPTHPEHYDDDLRHRCCNVCKAEFTCKPPTRLELMQSFTGEELASLVKERCIIGTHKKFSSELQRQQGTLPEHLREQTIDRHWIDGVFLISTVVADCGAPVLMTIPSQQDAATFARLVTDSWTWQLQGRLYRIVFAGDLADGKGGDDAQKRAAIENLQAPCKVKLVPIDDADIGEDGIVAVNLTRPFDVNAEVHVAKQYAYRLSLRKAFPEGEFLLAPVTHFIGGPCRPHKPECAVVITGRESYHIYNKLVDALKAAQSLCKGESPSRERSGSAAVEEELAEPTAKRTRVADDAATTGTAAGGADASSAAAADTTAAPGVAAAAPRSDIRVLVFWGTAGWSRCQLMGEIASGSWGLCTSSNADVMEVAPQDLYSKVYDRLVFAPKTSMSVEYLQVEPTELEQEARLRRLNRIHQRRVQEAQHAQQAMTLLQQLSAEDAQGVMTPESSEEDEFEEDAETGEEEDGDEDLEVELEMDEDGNAAEEGNPS